MPWHLATWQVASSYGALGTPPLERNGGAVLGMFLTGPKATLFGKIWSWTAKPFFFLGVQTWLEVLVFRNRVSGVVQECESKIIFVFWGKKIGTFSKNPVRKTSKTSGVASPKVWKHQVFRGIWDPVFSFEIMSSEVSRFSSLQRSLVEGFATLMYLPSTKKVWTWKRQKIPPPPKIYYLQSN